MPPRGSCSASCPSPRTSTARSPTWPPSRAPDPRAWPARLARAPTRALTAAGTCARLPRMAAWLFKTEPSDYSFDDLTKDRATTWSGVSNATALIHLRKVAKGDTVVVYHTGGEKRAVGLARVTRGAYPDPALGD